MQGSAASDETIVAIATPPGVSALAVVRVSGPACPQLIESTLGRPLTARRAAHRTYRSREGIPLDDVVAVWMPGPGSYTGEDVWEFSCHGNPFIINRLLADLRARGCRAAGPGEFTQRAFLNGRLDLSQAEAVMDIIQARSERSLALAQRQLGGALGRWLTPLQAEVLAILAHVEAYIDFPDEDLPAENRNELRSRLASVLRGTERLLATREYGDMLRQGVRVAIVGAPNVGKSSLLNALVGFERALVSNEPGTTRDFIEENLMVGGHWMRLVDTAGLNPRAGELERRGIELARERAREADLVLWVVDVTEPDSPPPAEIVLAFASSSVLRVANKVDLIGGNSGDAWAAWLDNRPQTVETLGVSAVSGEGLERLRQRLAELVDGVRAEVGDDVVAVNQRHADALERARLSLQEAERTLSGGRPAMELLASDLRAGLEALGEIAGRFDNERMLDRLFATFCIGK